MRDPKELRIGHGDETLYYAADMDAPGALEGFFDCLRKLVIEENMTDHGMTREEAEKACEALIQDEIARLKAQN